MLTGIVTAAANDLQIYQAIALGHLARKNRAAASVLAFIGISVGLTILMSLTSPMTRVLGEQIMALLNGNTAQHFIRGLNRAMGVLLVWNAVECAAFFFGSDAVLTHKLNLE